VNAVRWLVLIGAAVLLVALFAYARGPKHHHGDDVGSHGTRVVIIRR
jgi:hypothetical protein